jgi:hypothetical protein
VLCHDFTTSVKLCIKTLQRATISEDGDEGSEDTEYLVGIGSIFGCDFPSSSDAEAPLGAVGALIGRDTNNVTLRRHCFRGSSRMCFQEGKDPNCGERCRLFKDFFKPTSSKKESVLPPRRKALVSQAAQTGDSIGSLDTCAVDLKISAGRRTQHEMLNNLSAGFKYDLDANFGWTENDESSGNGVDIMV